MKKTAYVVLFALIAAACSHAGARKIASFDISPEEQTYSKVNSSLPQTMKVKQRLLLTIGKRAFDLDGMLVYQQPQNYYAAAYSEAPAPVFAFKAVQGRKWVVEKPRGLTEDIVVRGVMDDIITAYQNDFHGWHQLIDGTMDWKFRLDKNGLVSSKIAYSQYKKHGSFNIPEFIHIENFEIPYTLDIQMIEYSETVSEESLKKLFGQ